MSRQCVYNIFDPTSKVEKNRTYAVETKVLTEHEAMLEELKGFRVVNLTDTHGITPERLSKNVDLWPIGSSDELSNWGYLKYE